MPHCAYPVLAKLVLILDVLSPCLKFIHGVQVLAWLSFHATFCVHFSFHMRTRVRRTNGDCGKKGVSIVSPEKEAELEYSLHV